MDDAEAGPRIVTMMLPDGEEGEAPGVRQAGGDSLDLEVLG